jgi:integrase/recombinase XerD
MNPQIRPVTDEAAVVAFWRRGLLSSGTIQNYLQWVRRFRIYCKSRGLIETEQLTASGVRRFLRTYRGRRLRRPLHILNVRATAHHGLRAWACALRALGTLLPPWQEQRSDSLPPLLHEYRSWRRANQGIADSTLQRDLPTARSFLLLLRRRRKSVESAVLCDVDAFVLKCASRVSKSTVADVCSSLRAFLRFLQTTGRLSTDLARSVIGPRFRLSERPPRTLPWNDVRKILRSIPRSAPPGKRDFAVLLLLSTYGLGAAEVLGLRLEDLDWKAGSLRVRRPKTNVLIELPLLPAVADAITAYLRYERPPVQTVRFVFLRKNMPYERMTSAAIRHRIRHYARMAGISAPVIGAHVFRHSHASRQIDAGANIQVVSEILGHRSTSSTSVYVRVALRRLRSVGLPVPR